MARPRANAGFGLFTVRAQSQAITVSFRPTQRLQVRPLCAISAVISIFG